MPSPARNAARTSRSASSASTVSSGSPVQRIGLSATQRPLEEIGRFVAARRGRSSSSTPGGRRSSTSRSSCRSRTWRDLSASQPIRQPEVVDGSSSRTASAPRPTRSGRRSTRRCCSSSGQHRSTIVFVNNRRLAERLALRLNELAGEEIVRAHHGSLAREQRVEIEELLKARPDPVPRRHLARSSSASTWARSTSSCRSSRRSRSRGGFSASGVPGTRWARSRRGGSSPSSGRPPGVPRSSRAHARAARSRRRGSRGTRSTCSRSRSSRSAPTRSWSVGELHELVRRRLPVRGAARAASSRTCSTCWPGATRPTSSRSCGRGSCGTGRQDVVRGRDGRAAAGRHERGHDPRPRPLHRRPRRRRQPRRRARRGDGLRGPRRARRSCSAPRPGGSRRSRATGCSSLRRPASPGAVPFWKGEGVGRPHELGAAIGAASREIVSLAGRAGARPSAGGLSPRRARRAEPARASCASRRRRPAPCRPTGRWWSSGSATRSATGGCAS